MCIVSCRQTINSCFLNMCITFSCNCMDEGGTGMSEVDCTIHIYSVYPDTSESVRTQRLFLS